MLPSLAVTVIITLPGLIPLTTPLAVTAVLNKKNVSVYPGKTAKINVKYSNTTAQTTKVWASSNTSVATVDQNGVVKGVKAGKATISLTVQNPGLIPLTTPLAVTVAILVLDDLYVTAL